MKFRNKKGFTLMEMLIVVAIIAILVAILIPVMSSSLTKTKESADVANVRSVYAEWQVAILNGDSYTLPATNDKDAFLKGPDAGSAPEITYDDKMSVTNKDGEVTISYKPAKINGGEEYTWTLEAVDTE